MFRFVRSEVPAHSFDEETKTKIEDLLISIQNGCNGSSLSPCVAELQRFAREYEVPEPQREQWDQSFWYVLIDCYVNRIHHHEDPRIAEIEKLFEWGFKNASSPILRRMFTIYDSPFRQPYFRHVKKVAGLYLRLVPAKSELETELTERLRNLRENFSGCGFAILLVYLRKRPRDAETMYALERVVHDQIRNLDPLLYSTGLFSVAWKGYLKEDFSNLEFYLLD